MNPMETKKDYEAYVDKKSPDSPVVKNCFNAFWVGRTYLQHWSAYFGFLRKPRI